MVCSAVFFWQRARNKPAIDGGGGGGGGGGCGSGGGDGGGGGGGGGGGVHTLPSQHDHLHT